MKKLIWSGLGCSAVVLAFLFATPRAASVPQIQASAVAADVQDDGTTVHATFKIEVANRGDADATNFVVTFDDGSSVAIGDVSAGSTVDSDAVSRLIDRTNQPKSKSIAMPVTLSFTYNGSAQQQQSALTVSE